MGKRGIITVFGGLILRQIYLRLISITQSIMNANRSNHYSLTKYFARKMEIIKFIAIFIVLFSNKLEITVFGDEYPDYNLIPNSRANFMFLGIGDHNKGSNTFTGLILHKSLVLTVRSVCDK